MELSGGSSEDMNLTDSDCCRESISAEACEVSDGMRLTESDGGNEGIAAGVQSPSEGMLLSGTDGGNESGAHEEDHEMSLSDDELPMEMTAGSRKVRRKCNLPSRSKEARDVQMLPPIGCFSSDRGLEKKVCHFFCSLHLWGFLWCRSPMLQTCMVPNMQS